MKDNTDKGNLILSRFHLHQTQPGGCKSEIICVSYSLGENICRIFRV